MLFLFAVVVVEVDLKKGNSFWLAALRVSASLLRSPLLIAPVAGLTVGLSGMKVPAPFENFTTLLGGAASPTAEAAVASGAILASHIFAILTVSLLDGWLAQI